MSRPGKDADMSVSFADECITSLRATPVGQLAVEQPSWIGLLSAHGIDFCGGGRRTLDQACREKGLDAGTVAVELLGAEGDARATGTFPDAEVDWRGGPLAGLFDPPRA